MKLVFRPQAQEDLIKIYDYIAEDQSQNAVQFIDKLESTCKLLAEQPGMGKARTDLQPAGTFSFPTGNYLIFYKPEEDTLEILRIIHSSRDYQRLFH